MPQEQSLQHAPDEITEEQPQPGTAQAVPHVRRVRRRRKQTLKSRIKKALKNSGADKKLYIVAAGIIGFVVAVYLYDLLFALFPMKLK